MTAPLICYVVKNVKVRDMCNTVTTGYVTYVNMFVTTGSRQTSHSVGHQEPENKYIHEISNIDLIPVLPLFYVLPGDSTIFISLQSDQFNLQLL